MPKDANNFDTQDGDVSHVHGAHVGGDHVDAGRLVWVVRGELQHPVVVAAGVGAVRGAFDHIMPGQPTGGGYRAGGRMAMPSLAPNPKVCNVLASAATAAMQHSGLHIQGLRVQPHVLCVSEAIGGLGWAGPL